MITNTKQIAEHIERVDITEEMREVGCGRGNMDRKTVKCYTVTPVWKNVDRPSTGSYSCANNKKLAERLKRAIEDGVAFESIEIVNDRNCASYVAARMNILMRCANADLKKMGY